MLFSKSVFKLAVPLLTGAIVATGKRMVTPALRIIGLSEERNFPKYYRVLSLSKWSARKASEILLRQLLNCFLRILLPYKPKGIGFKTLKAELIYSAEPTTIAEMKIDVLEFIEIWRPPLRYNRKRMHASLGYLTPVEYEAKLKINRHRNVA